MNSYNSLKRLTLDCFVDDGKATFRHLPIPGSCHVPLPGGCCLHRSHQNDAWLLQVRSGFIILNSSNFRIILLQVIKSETNDFRHKYSFIAVCLIDPSDSLVRNWKILWCITVSLIYCIDFIKSNIEIKLKPSTFSLPINSR